MADESKTPLYEDPHCDDEDEEMDRRISQVAFVAYQQAKMKGIPVARYDAEKKAAYLLYPDGHPYNFRLTTWDEDGIVIRQSA